MTKENWIILLCIGLILMIAAMPSGESDGWSSLFRAGEEEERLETVFPGESGKPEEPEAEVWTGNRTESEDRSYEAILENRIRQVLSKVEGVGEVDVLIVLKTSKQSVYRADDRFSESSAQEKDSAGGTRDTFQQQKESSTVIVNGGTSAGSGPLLEKELYPELSGIVISAQGGGNPTVQAEITQAMEALFDLPAHKIKVLKRMDEDK